MVEKASYLSHFGTTQVSDIKTSQNFPCPNTNHLHPFVCTSSVCSSVCPTFSMQYKTSILKAITQINF